MSMGDTRKSGGRLPRQLKRGRKCDGRAQKRAPPKRRRNANASHSQVRKQRQSSSTRANWCKLRVRKCPIVQESIRPSRKTRPPPFFVCVSLHSQRILQFKLTNTHTNASDPCRKQPCGNLLFGQMGWQRQQLAVPPTASVTASGHERQDQGCRTRV